MSGRPRLKYEGFLTQNDRLTKINDGENSKQNKTDGGYVWFGRQPSLKVLSGEKDPAEIRLIRQIFLEGSVAWVFEQNSPVPDFVRAL